MTFHNKWNKLQNYIYTSRFGAVQVEISFRQKSDTKNERSYRASKLWHIWWQTFESFDMNEIKYRSVVLCAS